MKLEEEGINRIRIENNKIVEETIKKIKEGKNVVVVVYSFTIYQAVFKKISCLGSM